MDAALYLQVKQLVAEMPDLSTRGGPPGPEKLAWLGRASLLVAKVNGPHSMDPISIRVSADGLHGALQDMNAHHIYVIVHRALALAESQAPVAARGGFVAVGGAFDLYLIADKVLKQAKTDVLVIDPYMNSVAFTDFAPLVPAGVPLRMLADSFYTKESDVRAPTERWTQQHGSARPIETRLAGARRLHDRLLIVDNNAAWSLTQSLKDFAKRAPASVQQLDPDIAAAKIATYAQEWSAAAPLN